MLVDCAIGDVGVLPAPLNCCATFVVISDAVFCINGDKKGFKYCPANVEANCCCAAFAIVSCVARPCNVCCVGAT